ncbi:hypothetical protein IMSAG049_01051 [Clostridiales bacterium]|nr:hypothetical protein IMSAG049_01051 [Clostridiales bacterium]
METNFYTMKTKPISYTDVIMKSYLYPPFEMGAEAKP